ncbi:hypothetical protein MTO96_039589 [Rhipicephalus appendiculatus]
MARQTPHTTGNANPHRQQCVPRHHPGPQLLPQCARRAGPARITPSAGDHYFLTIQVITSLCKPRQHTARHTDWDVFRERRLHSAASNIEDLSTWTDQLLADLDAVTASIPTTEDHPAIDSRLAHLWAVRTGLTNRWHKQRHNRCLRRRISITP